MSDKFNISEEQLFDALQNAKSEVPADAWANIEVGMDSRKKRLAWWKIAIPGAALLFISIWGVLSYQDTQSTERDSVVTENQQPLDAVDQYTAKGDQQINDQSLQQFATPDLNDTDERAEKNSNKVNDKPTGESPELNTPSRENLKTKDLLEDKLMYCTAAELSPVHPIISAYQYPFVLNDSKSNIEIPILNETPSQNKKEANKNKFNANKNKPNAPFEIGVELNALLLGNQFTVNPERSNFVNRSYMDAINNTQKRSFGYQANLNIGKVFASGFMVSSGFGYQRRMEAVGFNHIIKEAPRVEANRGIVQYLELPKIGWDTIQYNGVNNYSLYRIPLKAGYDYTLNTKWSARINAGLNFIFLSEKQGKQIDETYLQLFDINQASIYRNNAMGWEAGLAVYRNFTRWNVAMELGYAKNINSILTEQSGVRVQPYQYGVSLKLNYLIGK